MKLTTIVLVLGSCGTLVAQGAGSKEDNKDGLQSSAMSESAQTPADAAQKRASTAFAAKQQAAAKMPKVAAKAAVLTPLSPRERVVQLLDRFTYGARPGDVDRVMAIGGDKWLASQLAPETIKDGATESRMKAYPTLAMTPQQALEIFPFFPQVGDVDTGKAPYPLDPLIKSVYEVQVYKMELDKDHKDADGKVVPKPILTDAQAIANKLRDKQIATRIAGELLAMPKEQRMAALIKMPVEDRVAFTSDGALTGDQKNTLLAAFTPREQETFSAMAAHIASSGQIVTELAQARVLRDILTEKQLQQVMTNFWFNHFNIYAPKDSDQWYVTSYERDVIRKDALGSFKDLLLATAQSPAMMVYLDNWLSVGPDSAANGVVKLDTAKRGQKGLNENYGREVMELHTVGVNGSYTQSDVTALAAILTGWGVDKVNQGGGFLFDPKRHEPGPKYWFGYKIDDDGTVTKLSPGTPMPQPTFGPSAVPATAESVQQGIAALKILAAAPQTARFLSTLLAQYFVADNPPASLVDRLTKVYLASNGDIKTMLRAVVASPEFNSKQYFHNKVKTPEEFVASAFRTTATDPTKPQQLVGTIQNMGMRLYYALPPTGYYLTAEQWMNSSALVDRLNFAYALTNGKFNGQVFDAPKLLAIGLMTPTGAGEVTAGARPVAATTKLVQPKLLGAETNVAETDGPTSPAPAATPSGTALSMRVLEQTMIAAPVSAQTNQLINKQLEQQPSGVSAIDTLNLLTALVMGSPEFQTR